MDTIAMKVNTSRKVVLRYPGARSDKSLLGTA